MASGIVPHIERHRKGTICAKGQTLDGELHGYWEWYRPNGTLKRSGSFDKGGKVGTWTTYDATGAPYKVTQVKTRI